VVGKREDTVDIAAVVDTAVVVDIDIESVDRVFVDIADIANSVDILVVVVDCMYHNLFVDHNNFCPHTDRS
jgi:hypothetical protein